MAWKATGALAVRKKRGRWVVRIDGFDTETRRKRPRQLGTYEGRRAAQQAAAQLAESGPPAPDPPTVAWAVDEWLATRTHVGPKTLTMYKCGGRHVKAGIGSAPLKMLERSDVGHWLNGLAAGGQLSRTRYRCGPSGCQGLDRSAQNSVVATCRSACLRTCWTSSFGASIWGPAGATSLRRDRPIPSALPSRGGRVQGHPPRLVSGGCGPPRARCSGLSTSYTVVVADPGLGLSVARISRRSAPPMSLRSGRGANRADR
jgi:hypothetical protein